MTVCSAASQQMSTVVVCGEKLFVSILGYNDTINGVRTINIQVGSYINGSHKCTGHILSF